jgi:hypothetical protein
MRRRTWILAAVLSLTFAGAGRSAAQARPETRTGMPSSQEMVWGLAWNVSLGVVGQARGGAPETVKDLRKGAELLADKLSVPLPAFPPPGHDQTKDLASAVDYILKTAGKPMAEAVGRRFGKQHVALLETGLKLPLLVLLYVPGDEAGRSLRQGIARAATEAGLPPALFKPLFDKVDAAAPWKQVMPEIVDLRDSVLKHLRSRPPA